MASSTSEYDSNTFTGEEMQRHFSYYFFSLTSDKSRLPQVATMQPNRDRSQPPNSVHGVRVCFIFASGCLSIPFHLQSLATLEEGNEWQMWEFIRI
jgi:hypothetical protein